MTVSVKHLNELYFFSTYRALSLYIKKNVPFVESYSLISPVLMKAYNSDSAYMMYDNAAFKIKNLRQAILKITPFLVINENYHISNFNPDKITNLEIYSKNKQKLIDDFKEELENGLVEHLLSGRLYSKMSTDKINVELYGYINVFYPIVKLARTYKTEDKYYAILKSINRQNKIDTETSIEKISNILQRYIETDTIKNKDLKERLSDLIQSKITEINRKTEKYSNTEETDYDLFYC